jgi:hypothetical protein
MGAAQLFHGVTARGRSASYSSRAAHRYNPQNMKKAATKA